MKEKEMKNIFYADKLSNQFIYVKNKKNAIFPHKIITTLQENAAFCNSSETDKISSARKCAIVCTMIAQY